MSLDPVETNPNHYKVVFENDRVRVLEYTDHPGDRTTPHEHPDSVMHTLSSFRRRLHWGDAHRDMEMPTGLTGGCRRSSMRARTSATPPPTSCSSSSRTPSRAGRGCTSGLSDSQNRFVP